MKKVYIVSKPDRHLEGEITPERSKSICNRALIIQALCEDDFKIHHISNSKDSEVLQQLLHSKEAILDAGAAGTTFRFMTAYLSTQQGTRTLTGSERMKERPIGILVDALRSLGAEIEYLEKEGYPPLQIIGNSSLDKTKEISIKGNISSQYISALLMIAPTLPNGLTIHITNEISSRPYLQMTLNLMKYFGINYTEDETLNNLAITILPQKYIAKDFTVETDWSAASYHYAMAAFSSSCNLKLYGYQNPSLQGDAHIAEIMQSFGVATTFHDDYIVLTKNKDVKPMFEFDFSDQPDLAQTIAVVSAGLGLQGLYSGLHSLRIKETDRIQALENELAKMQVYLSKMPARFSKTSDKEFFMQEGKAVIDLPTFETYDDHRMALAFATLAMFAPVKILDPDVVEKSYPRFWEDLRALGFVVEDIS